MFFNTDTAFLSQPYTDVFQKSITTCAVSVAPGALFTLWIGDEIPRFRIDEETKEPKPFYLPYKFKCASDTLISPDSCFLFVFQAAYQDR